MSGYRDDGDAGLVHVGARYYEPQVGRFVTRDTDLDEHPYLYCEHNPVNALDPSGHDAGWALRGRDDPWGIGGGGNGGGIPIIIISITK